MPDQLSQIFQKQHALNKRIGIDATRLTEHERNHWTYAYICATLTELAEAANKLQWKWWKQPKQTDWADVHEELADALHFFVSAMLCSGLSADEAFGEYVKKHEINHQRQDGGY